MYLQTEKLSAMRQMTKKSSRTGRIESFAQGKIVENCFLVDLRVRIYRCAFSLSLIYMVLGSDV